MFGAIIIWGSELAALAKLLWLDQTAKHTSILSPPSIWRFFHFPVIDGSVHSRNNTLSHIVRDHLSAGFLAACLFVSAHAASAVGVNELGGGSDEVFCWTRVLFANTAEFYHSECTPQSSGQSDQGCCATNRDTKVTEAVWAVVECNYLYFF